MQSGVEILVLLLIGIVIFVIYFTGKVLGFVINATRLYRRMIARQDAIIRLLLDIRDSTKKFDENELASLAKMAEDERTED